MILPIKAMCRLSTYSLYVFKIYINMKVNAYHTTWIFQWWVCSFPSENYGHIIFHQHGTCGTNFLSSKHWFKRPFDFCLASLCWCHWQTRWFRKNHAKTRVLQIKMHPTNTLILSTMPRTGIVIAAPSNKLLDKTKPSAAKAQPEALFNKVMATGMSAPPTCGSETVDNVLDLRMLDAWKRWKICAQMVV